MRLSELDVRQVEQLITLNVRSATYKDFPELTDEVGEQNISIMLTCVTVFYYCVFVKLRLYAAQRVFFTFVH